MMMMMLAPRSFHRLIQQFLFYAAENNLLSFTEPVSVTHPLKRGSLCVALLHYFETLLMFIVMHVLFFLIFEVGIAGGPSWKVEGGAQEKKFGNCCFNGRHFTFGHTNDPLKGMLHRWRYIYDFFFFLVLFSISHSFTH